MENWFESKVKYTGVDESGKEKKMTETYLVDAMSYTEAEARTVERFKDVQADWHIVSIKKSNIDETLDLSGEKWYKAKVAIVDADRLTGKEKRTFKHMLLSASDIDDAFKLLQKEIEKYVVPAEIVSLSDSPVVDVIKYE